MNYIPDNSSQFRLFISSTFKDMDEERTYLVEWIFPKIKELCAERGVEFFPIDLRWGITEQEGKEGKILYACMGEIDNSRPFFIGLLGDRYGWQPTIADLGESAPMLLERYPWIEKDIKDGLSITEMEMQYGALRQTNMEGAFYIRKEAEESKAKRFFRRINSADYRHLEHLKETIRKNNNVVSREYESPEQLGELVFQDVKDVIDRQFPLKPTSQRHALHERSFSTHLANFVHLEHYYQQIEQILTGPTDNKYLVLHGMKGSGKSTVLCSFLEQYQNEYPNTTVIYYDIAKAFMHPLIGWSKNGHLCENSFVYEADKLLKEIDDELEKTNALNKFIDAGIKKILNTPEADSLYHENLESIIALDNIEYLPSNKHAVFIQKLLNHPFPPHTKIILTHMDFEFNPYHSSAADLTESYISIDALNAHKICIAGMNREDIPSFVEQYLKAYGKKLTAEQLMRFKKPLYATNPYYLSLALFQLVELGSFEELDKTVNYLTSNDSSRDTELEMFEWSACIPITYILDNVVCRDGGNNEKGRLMPIMWLMFRNRGLEGFTENELINIFHFTPARWALLRPQVMELCRFNNGYIEFNDNMFSLILGRIARERMAEVQEQVIAYYETIPWLYELEEEFKKNGVTSLSATQKAQVKQSLRKAEILPWYLHFQKKYDQLKQYFSDPLIRNNIPSYVVSHFEKIMDENAK